MKYSITVLQAEIKRFENAIKANDKRIKRWQTKDKASFTDYGLNKDALIKKFRVFNVINEKLITELKADIKKL